MRTIYYAVSKSDERGFWLTRDRVPFLCRTQGEALSYAIAGEVVVPVRVELIFNKPWKRKK